MPRLRLGSPFLFPVTAERELAELGAKRELAVVCMGK